MNLLRNPEFVRNCWLELSPQRLVAMPAILGLLFLLCHLSNTVAGMSGHFPGVHSVALVLFVGITLLWGARLATNAMVDEFDAGTWDTQRLCSLSPGQMALGKLLGGPVFAWYGGLICGLVFLYQAPEGLPEAIRTLLTAVAVALCVHALAILVSLSSWRKLAQGQRSRSRGIGILLGIFFLSPLRVLFQHSEHTVRWYGSDFALPDFALLCAVLAAFWSLLGLYRAMREELAVRQRPVAWIGFLLFLDVFVGGWVYGNAPVVWLNRMLLPSISPLLMHLALCGVVTMTIVYVVIFTEQKDWVRLRRMHGLWQGGRWSLALALMPKWLVALVLSALTAFAFVALAAAELPLRDAIRVGAMALGLLAFLVRDCGLILGLNFTRDRRRADSAAMLYLVVLYVLLPLMLRFAGLGLLVPALVPQLQYDQPVWVLISLFEAALSLAFALQRWGQLPAVEIRG